jgi:ATPase subunit of ABC transporter with duplicated ATPase domains
VTILIQANDLGYAHGGNQVFRGLTFEIEEGDRISLIGENGAGKSTLFRLLAREIPPMSGEVVYRRNTIIGYLEQEPSISPDTPVLAAVRTAGGDLAATEARMRELETLMTTAEGDAFDQVLDEYGRLQEQFEASGGYGDDARAEEVLTGLGFGAKRWGQPFGELSGGEKKLVGLARLLLQDADVLLLDEPDNHLDFAGKRWIETFMKTFRGAVAIISHDRYFLDRAVNKTFELEDGELFSYPAAYTGFLEAKRERLAREAQLRELREREFKQIKHSAEMLTQWARQNPKFARRAGNRWRMLEIRRQELASKPKPILERRTIDVDFQGQRGSQVVLRLEGVSKALGDRPLLEPFDLMITHGECVGLVGVNGSGKTTLFRMILGREEPTTGVVKLGPSIRVGYYSQEQETLDPEKTPLEIVRNLKSYTEPQAISFLSSLLFDYQDATNQVRNLSGGERSRLQIAVLMLQGANFLMLDEPTNNLDIASCEELESALLAFEGTILTISHDRYFLDKLCNRIIELDNGLVREYRGGFGWFEQRQGQGSLLTI